MLEALRVFLLRTPDCGCCDMHHGRRPYAWSDRLNVQTVSCHSKQKQDVRAVVTNVSMPKVVHFMSSRRPRVRQGRVSRRGSPFTKVRLRTMKVGSQLFFTGMLSGRVICSSSTWQHFPNVTSTLSESCCRFHDPSPDEQRSVHRYPFSHSSIQPLEVIPSCIQLHTLLPPKCHAELRASL